MGAKKKTAIAIGPKKFAEVVAVTKQLMDNSIIKVRVSVPGNVDLHFEPQRVRSTAVMSSIDPDVFEETLKGVIADMISAILSRRRNVYTSYVVQQARVEVADEAKFDEDAIRRLIRKQIGLVEKQLVTRAMRRELSIKSTSKANVFHRLAWEINVKHFDQTGDQPENLAYATLRLDVDKMPLPDRPIFPPRVFGPETLSVVFDASLGDVRILQETVAEIGRRLEELESGEEK